MPTFTRDQIGLRPPKGGPGLLDVHRVTGLAFHWPAMERPLRGPAAVMAALRGWQSFHMDGQGWSDIGYQAAIDQDGNYYELRGLWTQSGANGSTDANEENGAVLLILAPGEQLSQQMVDTVRVTVARHRARFPNSRRLLGHQDVRPEPTACPGPAVMAALSAGVFEPQPEPKSTRGTHVDAALRHLRKTTHTGTAGARVARAIRVLSRIKPWRS